MMWHASRAWIGQVVESAMLNGSVPAVMAYSVLHSREMLAFVRCRLIGCGPSPDR